MEMEKEDFKKTFARNLKHYMHLNAKEQIDLIKDLSINKSAISTWCNGTRLPRMDKIDLLANYFGITRSDLIEARSGEDTDYMDNDMYDLIAFLHQNPEYKEIIDVIRNIDKEEMHFATQMLIKMYHK